MAIDRIPSFWDQLAGGIQNAQDSYRHEIDTQKADQERQLQNIMSMFGMGAVDSGVVNQNPAVRAMGVTVQPNQPELRRRVVAKDSAPPNVYVPTGVGGTQVPVKTGMANDTERIAAGMPTSGQMAQDRLAGEQARYSINYVPSDLELKRAKELDPLIENAAQANAAMAITQAGGRITPQNIQALGEHAFQMYMDNREKNRLGPLGPEGMTSARAHFHKAVYENYLLQQRLDAERAAANARLGNSASRTYLGMIQNEERLNQSRLSQMLDRNPILKLFAYGNVDTNDKDIAEAIKMYGPQITEFQNYMQREKDLQDALSMLSQDIIPPNVARLLSSSGEGVGAPRTPAPTTSAVPAPGTPGGSLGTGGTRTGGKSATEDAAHKARLNKLQTFTPEDQASAILDGVKAKTLTINEANKLSDDLGIPRPKVTTNGRQ